MDNLYSTDEHNLLLSLPTHLAKSCSQELFPFSWAPSLGLWQPVFVQTRRLTQLQWNKQAHRCTSCTPAKQVSFTCPAVTSWHTRAVQGWDKRVSHKLLGQLSSDHIKSCLFSIKEGWDLKNHLRSVQPSLPTCSKGAVHAQSLCSKVGRAGIRTAVPSHLGSLLQFQSPLPSAAKRHFAAVLLSPSPNKIWTYEFKALWSRIF